MPALKNGKHEKFAQGLAKGMTGDDAYEAAGYAANRGNAARLKANESVLKRVGELQERVAERTIVTIESLIQEAADIQAAASQDGQHSAAISALTAKAKLAGLWIEKTDNRNRNVEPERLSDGELTDIASAGRDRAAKTQEHPQKLN